MNDTLLAIAVADMRPACKDEPDLTERLRKAMKAAQSFWMSTDDDLRFRGACGAAMLESPEDEKQKIVYSVQEMRKVNMMLMAAMSGASVDIAATLDGIDMEKVLPLKKLWDEAKAAVPV